MSYQFWHISRSSSIFFRGLLIQSRENEGSVIRWRKDSTAQTDCWSERRLPSSLDQKSLSRAFHNGTCKLHTTTSTAFVLLPLIVTLAPTYLKFSHRRKKIHFSILYLVMFLPTVMLSSVMNFARCKSAFANLTSRAKKTTLAFTIFFAVCLFWKVKRNLVEHEVMKFSPGCRKHPAEQQPFSRVGKL